MNAQEFVNRPMVEWDELTANLSGDERLGLSNDLAALAEKASRAAAYVESRVASGNHSDAVKAQNKLASKVRYALGYAVPKSNVSF